MTEPRLAEALRRLQADLHAIDVRWALVGGLAVSARAEPRTTRDVDVAVASSGEQEAENLVHRLRQYGYREIAVLFQENLDRMAAVRFERREPGRWILCDMLLASSGIEREIVEEADLLEVLPDLFSPVATVSHLLAMKTLALRPDRPQDRPQDFADIRELLRVADETEIEKVRDALMLISRRGFDRGVDLIDRFESQLEEFRRGSGGFSG